MTPYLKFHPGGVTELMKGAGRDATALCEKAHPYVNVHNMVDKCLVGENLAINSRGTVLMSYPQTTWFSNWDFLTP